MSKRFLVSFNYSDWVDAYSAEDAINLMYERICALKRHEWLVHCEDEEGLVTDV